MGRRRKRSRLHALQTASAPPRSHRYSDRCRYRRLCGRFDGRRGHHPSPDDPLTRPSAVTRGELPDGEVRLKADGTVTLLNFFATWCTPCQREMDDFRRLRAAYAPDALHMVSITPEVDRSLVREFWAEYPSTPGAVRARPLDSDGSS